MKDYELTVVFHPDLEMNLDPALDKVKKLIEQNGGKITKEENDGKKRLAYSVNGQDFAVYYYFNVNLPAEAPAKISSVLNITDEVLRFLLVREDELKAKLAARRKAKADDKEEVTEEKGE
ncbi:30S ribosomal protein S6 [Candidatus Saccharibacteria bacterium]|nr:30S ribosomal protein S6 [Candidatus Saccharibacteria bacterium]